MIFPGFPGVLSFFQVFQVEWEPWTYPPPTQKGHGTKNTYSTPVNRLTDTCENITFLQLMTINITDTASVPLFFIQYIKYVHVLGPPLYMILPGKEVVLD